MHTPSLNLAPLAVSGWIVAAVCVLDRLLARLTCATCNRPYAFRRVPSPTGEAMLRACSWCARGGSRRHLKPAPSKPAANPRGR
jgi:hypothetical protein